jgi:polyhydroxybutyrate depolymerase
MRWTVVAFGLGLMIISGGAQACGPDTDCMIGDRTYRISMPQDGKARGGAILWSHGYRGSAKAAMRNAGLRALAHEQGMALVALKSASDDWLIPGVPENPSETGATEFDYYDAVIAELRDRHGINTDRLIASGFSAGGMMVWNLACYRGDRFKAFIPVAGTFWEPVPTECPTYPVDLIHVQGMADKIVPPEGRPIADSHQGNVYEALDRLDESGAFVERDSQIAEGELTCQVYEGEQDGRLSAFCSHPGDHSFKTAYLRTALQLLRDNGRF